MHFIVAMKPFLIYIKLLNLNTTTRFISLKLFKKG